MSNSHHRYIHNLTPLRGFAALWVGAYHYRMSMPGFATHDITNVLTKGYMMVDLFFIMSGFIILHVYGSTFTQRATRPALRKYFIARFARTYPLHFFTLALLVLMTCISGQWNIVNDPAAIPTHLLLLQSFGVHQLSTWNRVSWSLSAEWASYVAFPLLSIFFYQRKKLALAVLPVLIAISYIALMYWLPPAGIGNAMRLILHQLDVTYDYGFLRGLAGFALGMICYDAYLNPRIKEFFSSDVVIGVLTVITLYYMYAGVNDIILIILFSGIVLCFASNCAMLHKFCSLRPVQLIGKVSYSIYLIQWFVATLLTSFLELPFIRRILPPLETTSFTAGLLYEITYLCLLTAFSAFTYYTIENHCRNYINRKFIEPRKSSLTSTAANPVDRH